MNAILRRRFLEQIMVMFGREPKKPEAIQRGSAADPFRQAHHQQGKAAGRGGTMPKRT
ncbi:MAG: hypothetical protein M5R42_00980 [Rhodocyclaceae bacterium]|nr:hypothetical protein [Rhodocyclaceae bacterium]